MPLTPYGARRSRLPAPPGTVWDSLVDPRRVGARPWLALADDEVEPRLLDGERPVRVVWSSPWPARPHDQVHIVLAPHGLETAVGYTLLTPDEPPDPTTAERLRRRISVLLFAELRESYGQ